MIAMRDAPRREGTVLILCLVLGVAVLGFIAAAATMARTSTAWSEHLLERTAGVAVAEAVSETALRRLREEIANFELLPDEGITLSGVVEIGGADYSYDIEPIGVDDGFLFSRTDPADGALRLVSYYRLRASAGALSSGLGIERIVEVRLMPVIEYAAFYDGALEILPGSNMTISGRIHTNSNLYIGAVSGRTLTLDTTYLRAGGEIYRRRLDGTQQEMPGTVNIRVTTDPIDAPAQFASMGVSQDFEDYAGDPAGWVSFADERWGGTVRTASHGVERIAVPEIGSIQAFRDGEPGFYHGEAGLVIRDGRGFRRTPSGGLEEILNLPAGTITESQIYDAREGKYVTVTNVDLDLLGQASAFPENRLIYAYRTTSSATQPNGIRFRNGASLANDALIVSPNPVYLQGDFNTIDKKGAALICDAVNVLSNGWDDSKVAGAPITNYVAEETTFNVALVTGNVPTGHPGGAYSGGFENLARLHENWSNINLHINGGFVCIFESEIARAPVNGAAYRAPRRNFTFDTDIIERFVTRFSHRILPCAVEVRRVLWRDGRGSLLDENDG